MADPKLPDVSGLARDIDGILSTWDKMNTTIERIANDPRLSIDAKREDIRRTKQAEQGIILNRDAALEVLAQYKDEVEKFERKVEHDARPMTKFKAEQWTIAGARRSFITDEIALLGDARNIAQRIRELNEVGDVIGASTMFDLFESKSSGDAVALAEVWKLSRELWPADVEKLERATNAARSIREARAALGRVQTKAEREALAARLGVQEKYLPK